MPRWGANIGECMTRGWSAERRYIGVCMARVSALRQWYAYGKRNEGCE